MACRGCSAGDGCSCSVVGSADSVVTFSGSGTPITDPYLPTFHGSTWMESLTENNADCDTLLTPRIPVILGDGSAVTVPLPCITVAEGHFGGNAFSFTFLGTTTDTDPGGGNLQFNNATVSAVTQIFVDTTDYLATDITAWLDSLSTGKIRIYQKSNPTIWADFTLTGVTAGAGYRKLAVTYVDNNGIFGNDLGDTVLDFAFGGSAGPTGPAGPAGGVGFLYTYSATLTDSDPGTGIFRLNNATMSSVTQVFIDLLAFGGADVTTFLDSLDDSTNTVKGYLKFSSVSDQTKWVMFAVTGWTTATGYRKLTVSWLDHNGTLTTTAGDTMLSWSRAGDAGVIAPQSVDTTKSTSFTLAIGQAEKMIPCGGGTVVVTVPLNSVVAFPVGTHIDFWATTAANVSFAATGGVTLQSEAGYVALATQYTGATLIKLATDTWALMGKLS